MSTQPTVTGDLTPAEVRTYLDEATIPVRIACRTPDGGLWMVSLWFSYADGILSCATSADALLVRYLREDPHVALEVSTNDPPYRGVRGAGTATLAADEDKALLRSLLERYLGGTESDLAKTLLAPAREEVRIDVDIERLYGWDFSERMPGSPTEG